jgi:hypothetical protein
MYEMIVCSKDKGVVSDLGDMLTSWNNQTMALKF